MLNFNNKMIRLVIITVFIVNMASLQTFGAPNMVPSIFSATATATTTTISWSRINKATGYDIEARGTIIDVGTNRVFDDTGLNSGILYSYRVRSKDASGPSDWSAMTNVYTLPAVPTNITTTPAATSITLNWTNPVGATGYDVERDGTIAANIGSTSYTQIGRAHV